MRSDACDAVSFISQFNECATPKEVLRFAEPVGVDTTAELLYASGANAELLGACLGHHHSFFKQLVHAFPKCFEFCGIDVVTALRKYLWCFRLPGESAQIERILEGFAHAFFDANPPSCRPISGWFTSQPSGELCCIACGSTADKERQDRFWLQECHGCRCVTFCRPCRKTLRAVHGHAIGGVLGYGRACVAALRARGLISENSMQFTNAYGEKCRIPVDEQSESSSWVRSSPFLTEDAVMVLCYAVIMLTTNLHNENVKIKMKKHEFIMQNRGVNHGSNFPGDFLSCIYDDIAAQELKVMKSGDA